MLGIGEELEGGENRSGFDQNRYMYVWNSQTMKKRLYK